MQIFELTQPRRNRLNEYDPKRSPPGTPNYATGVGPGVAGQRTVTPAPAGQPAAVPASAPAATPDYSGGQQTVTPTLKAPAAPAPAATPNYSAGNYNQTSNAPTANMPATSTAMPSNMQPASAPAASTSQPTYNAPAANIPATNTTMPSNMSATGTPASATAPAPTTSPSLGTVLPLLPASKVGLKAAPARGVNIGGAIANALMKHNANSAGLGYLLPKDPDTEVHVDHTGKVTVGNEPYDAKNPVHQQAAGIITIGGQPYNPNNPQHRGAYLAFKDTAGKGGTNQVKIDKNGKVTVFGQPFDPSNPSHIMAYNQHVLGSSVQTTPPAQQPAQPAQSSRPPAQQPSNTAARPGQPAQSSPAAQTPEQIRIAKQKAAAAAAQQTMAPKAPTTESLTWSRGFDPSATLLKKMKSQ